MSIVLDQECKLMLGLPDNPVAAVVPSSGWISSSTDCGLVMGRFTSEHLVMYLAYYFYELTNIFSLVSRIFHQ